MLPQRNFRWNNTPNQRDHLNKADNSPKASHSILILPQYEEHCNKSHRQHNQSGGIPQPAAEFMRIVPGILIFHRHACPVSEGIINLSGGFFQKSPSEPGHSCRNQQIHNQHKNPETHRIPFSAIFCYTVISSFKVERQMIVLVSATPLISFSVRERKFSISCISRKSTFRR